MHADPLVNRSRFDMADASRAIPGSAGSTLGQSLVTLALVALLYVAVIALAALLWRQPILLTVIYLPLAGFVLWRWWGIDTIASFLTGFLLGPLGEFFAVWAGAWSYAGHERLPPWLPLAWGIAVVVMQQIVLLVGAWRARRHNA